MNVNKGLLLVVIFLISTFSIVVASQIQPTVIQGLVGYLPENSELTITFFIPPKNLNLLYYTAQLVANGQIPPLSPQELFEKFAQKDKLNELVNFLESQGFRIVYNSPFSIVAISKVSTVEKVFNTKLGLFNISGSVYYRPLIPPSAPEIFDSIIVGGLENATVFKPLNVKLEGFKPSDYFQFSAISYTPQQLRAAYNVTGNGGKNVTIGIIVAYGDPLIYEDLKSFDSKFNLPPVNLTVIPIGPYHPEAGIWNGWSIETALDVEAAHSMAPYANISLIVASNAGSTLFAAVDYVVTKKAADVVSMSWGLPENLFGASGFYAFYHGMSFPNYPYLDYYFALGTAEGITFFAASGDNGAYGYSLTTYGAAIFPASSPFVTAVGGTSLFLNYTSNSYGYETAWSVLPQYFGTPVGTISSGGGVSSLFPKPWYQFGITNYSTRTIPDVAAVGNPYTGMKIIALGSESVIGGTSLSSPLWAGIMANVISELRRPIGLLNPILYWIYKNDSLYSKAFHQITFGYNGKYYASKGYNLVTGIGSPNVGELINAIKAYYRTNSNQLKITLMTSGELPWYMYGDNFTIVAYITYPNNIIVREGEFTAYIYTIQGYLDKVPLRFNGTHWIGEYEVRKGQPPNVWTIVVNGTSGNFYGISSYDIVIGQSINIIYPIPYPFNFPLAPNTYFPIIVEVYNPNGLPAINESVNAYLIKDNKIVESVKLLPSRAFTGEYTGSLSLISPSDQGVYLLLVNSTYGSAYTYLVFGNVIFGAIFTPINTGFPSVAVGQNITIIAYTLSPTFEGVLSSDVTAYIYKDGKLMAKVPLIRAPNSVLFGIYNLFYLYYNNFTIPSNFTAGFYDVIIESKTNTSKGLTIGEFFTSFYVSPSTLGYKVSVKSIAFEGENVKIYAKITYPNGSDVKYGIINAVLMPTSITYASLLVGYYTGVEMHYESKSGLWVGEFRIPSVLESNTFYQGSPPDVLRAGSWLHAGVQGIIAKLIPEARIEVPVSVIFNEFQIRGRIDLLSDSEMFEIKSSEN
ncbi:MAG: protease pro-enzyme activation domain-containing protein, partial [Sulfolobaceae archaeon]